MPALPRVMHFLQLAFVVLSTLVAPVFTASDPGLHWFVEFPNDLKKYDPNYPWQHLVTFIALGSTPGVKCGYNINAMMTWKDGQPFKLEVQSLETVNDGGKHKYTKDHWTSPGGANWASIGPFYMNLPPGESGGQDAPGVAGQIGFNIPAGLEICAGDAGPRWLFNTDRDEDGRYRLAYFARPIQGASTVLCPKCPKYPS